MEWTNDLPEVLLIDASDFETFPAGGQLTMARSLMKMFGERLGLVGISTGAVPTGTWTAKTVAGRRFAFFGACRRAPSARRPLVPARLTFYAALRRHKARILSQGARAAFIQSPEALLAVSGWNWQSTCFRFAGVENPLRVSRYAFARPLWRVFDRAIMAALTRTDLILAAADDEAIGGLVERSRGRLTRRRLQQMPTCVDSAEFHPVPLAEARAKVDLPLSGAVFVNCGRIGRFKGWDLLVEAFRIFRKSCPDAHLVFAGDGEDRPGLQARVEAYNLRDHVHVTGFQPPARLRYYLNAANVVVFGSLAEGWSTAMLEALACGKPIVSTRVSGAAALIRQGQNGFIVADRNPMKFADAIERALSLPLAQAVSTSIAADFNLDRMRERLAALWPPFSGAERSKACDAH